LFVFIVLRTLSICSKSFDGPLIGALALFGLAVQAGLVVEVDSMGQVLRTLRDPTAAAYWVSEAEQHGAYLYLGSWRTPFLARAKAPR
jgi:hypothetical protein